MCETSENVERSARETAQVVDTNNIFSMSAASGAETALPPHLELNQYKMPRFSKRKLRLGGIGDSKAQQ